MKISKKQKLCVSGNKIWNEGWLFYGISTLVGYLMQNPIYTYILNVYNL